MAETLGGVIPGNLGSDFALPPPSPIRTRTTRPGSCSRLLLPLRPAAFPAGGKSRESLKNHPAKIETPRSLCPGSEPCSLKPTRARRHLVHGIPKNQRRELLAFLLASLLPAICRVETFQIVRGADLDPARGAIFYKQTQQLIRYCQAARQLGNVAAKTARLSSCGSSRHRSDGKYSGPYEACVQDAVTTFDSFVRQCVKQLLLHVPMTPARRGRLERMYSHDRATVEQQLSTVFDIWVTQETEPLRCKVAALMFHRRDVYEHNGGDDDK
jgi:hypothetical protein